MQVTPLWSTVNTYVDLNARSPKNVYILKKPSWIFTNIYLYLFVVLNESFEFIYDFKY